MFDENHYVPLLKCKRGELSAVAGLSAAVRQRLTPLFDLLYDNDFDPDSTGVDAVFETRALRYVPQLVQSWGAGSPLFIDAGLVDPAARVGGATHIITAVFNDARASGLLAVPVTGFDRDPFYQAAVRNAVYLDRRGACLRLDLADLGRMTLAADMTDLMTFIGVKVNELDVIIDLGADAGGPNPNLLANLIVGGLRTLPYAVNLRTLTLAGGAFPQSLAAYPVGINAIPRTDWQIYNMVRAAALPRLPTYGDYATRHPVLGDIDPALVNTSASVRYTREYYWLVLRGHGVKTPGGGGFGQYRTHAQNLVSRPEYCGPNFSAGDQEIYDIATGAANPGNHETWVRIAVNHHLTFVTSQTGANPLGFSGTPGPVLGPVATAVSP
jgi:hypothetical protein